jgi:hypothetical protein
VIAMTNRSTVAEPTSAQVEALERLACAPESEGIWWHDLPHPTREVLLRNGWLHEIRGRRAACNSHGRKHLGYVTISAAGLRAIGR